MPQLYPEYKRAYYHNVIKRKRQGLPPLPFQRTGRAAQRETKYAEMLALFTAEIKQFWLEKGYPPDICDLAARVGLSAKSATWYWLNRFRQDGQILFEEKIERTIRLPNMGVVFDETVRTDSSEG